jgi:uncharacterized protein (TIGR02611 family)
VQQHRRVPIVALAGHTCCVTEADREQEQAAGVLTRLAGRFEHVRAGVHRRPGGVAAWRIAIAAIGLVVVIVGIVLLVLPGPGWLVIFVGLGIWATEFKWAELLLKGVRRRVTESTAWLRRQPPRRVIATVAIALLILVAIAVGVWLLVS